MWNVWFFEVCKCEKNGEYFDEVVYMSVIENRLKCFIFSKVYLIEKFFNYGYIKGCEERNREDKRY